MNLGIWGTKSEAVYLAKQISKNSGYVLWTTTKLKQI